MKAGIVDHHLNRPFFQQLDQQATGLLLVGDIEDRHPRRAADRLDGVDHFRRALGMPIGVDADLQACLLYTSRCV